jgi:hypothetical protein
MLVLLKVSEMDMAYDVDNHSRLQVYHCCINPLGL